MGALTAVCYLPEQGRRLRKDSYGAVTQPILMKLCLRQPEEIRAAGTCDSTQKTKCWNCLAE